MIFKTHGIVLNYVKFRESSIIVKIYTKDFGLKTYIVNSVRSTRSKANKIAYYQPLTLLDLVIYNRENRDINRISEVRILYPFNSIPFEHKKNLMTIFISEVMTKLLKEEDSDEDLFNFIKDSITNFDKQAAQFENFHIRFLMQLTNYLGFAPQQTVDFCNFPGGESAKDASFFPKLCEMFEKPNEHYVETSGQIRSQILEHLIHFYQYHIQGFGEVKSFLIIKELH
jgi:DNA repair protein RecO (recombination protein O)